MEEIYFAALASYTAAINPASVEILDTVPYSLLLYYIDTQKYGYNKLTNISPRSQACNMRGINVRHSFILIDCTWYLSVHAHFCRVIFGYLFHHIILFYGSCLKYLTTLLIYT